MVNFHKNKRNKIHYGLVTSFSKKEYCLCTKYDRITGMNYLEYETVLSTKQYNFISFYYFVFRNTRTRNGIAILNNNNSKYQTFTYLMIWTVDELDVLRHVPCCSETEVQQTSLEMVADRLCNKIPILVDF